MRPNAACVDCSSPGRRRNGGNGYRAEAARALLACNPRAVDQRLDAGPRIVAETFERLPFVALTNTHRFAQRGQLGRVHQSGVIVLVAGKGQAEALDRPGDEQGRDVVLRGIERFDQRLHAVAAEVGKQLRQRIVGIFLQERRGLPAELGFDPFPPCSTALIMKRRQLGIGQLLEPVLQTPMLRQRSVQLLAVAQLHHAPAAAPEDLVEPLEHPVGAGRVEALTVVVDDPPQVADVVLGALDDRLVDIALVELGIADQRDKSAAVLLLQPAVRGEIILHEAGEERDGHAKSDRAGREIDRDPVLGPARIALRAAEPAEILQCLTRLAPEQIMDGVEHRPGMRLHRHAVVRLQGVEIERRHDRGHRGAARLMAADLQPVGALADVVRVVDGPGRQPPQPLVEGLQRFDVGR